MTKIDTFATRMISRRAALGMSQNELSKSSGVAAAQISRYEQGVNVPRATVIAKLATALMVPFGWLATGDESELRSDPPKENEIDCYIEIPKKTKAWIEEAAEKEGISTDQFVQNLLKAAMDRDLSE